LHQVGHCGLSRGSAPGGARIRSAASARGRAFRAAVSDPQPVELLAKAAGVVAGGLKDEVPVDPVDSYVDLGVNGAAIPERYAGAFVDGARRIRTADLLGAIQALCQLSYSPEGEGRGRSCSLARARIPAWALDFPRPVADGP
jgi:hypothetical protein